MTIRTVEQLIQGLPTSDGAGVRLTRTLGSQGDATRIDPFLMLDEFASDNAEDYLAGFPNHPHRGFETVTYMLEGHMLHEDHMGNRGDLLPGMVQWMTAGRGVIHSEMPQQTEGRMQGFQLWLNLPAKDKMVKPSYRDIKADEIPVVELAAGGKARVVAGQVEPDGKTVNGAINPEEQPRQTDPIYIDVELPAGASFELPLAQEYNAFAYVFEGQIQCQDRHVATKQAARFGAGDRVSVKAGEQGARFLFIAGKPLDEPIVQYGPFVMNTREEIEQTLQDYSAGKFSQTA